MENRNGDRMDGPSQEIDLVDLGVLFWRRRRVIVATFLVLFVLTIVAAIIKQPTYSYTTTMDLGTMTTDAGVQIQLIPTQTAQQTLTSTYIPSAIAEYAAKHPDELQRLQGLRVEVTGKDADAAVLLVCKAHEAHADACINVEKMAADSFIKANSNQVAVRRANIQVELAAANLKLAAIKDPAVFGVQKLAAEKAIADAKSELAKLQSDLAVLKVRQEKLTASQKLYEKNVEQLQKHVADVRKANLTAAKGSADPTNAMANLLLSTEEQRSVNLISDLEQKLNVSLPEQFAKVKADIADNARDQTLQKQTIQQNETALKKLDFSHQQSIASQQLAIQQIQTQLDNIEETRVLGKALQSLRPVGLGRMAILALGIVASFVLALFAAFLMGFVGQVRVRLASGDSGSS